MSMSKTEESHVFKVLGWDDESFTQERINHIEQAFGPLARNLKDLATLIRELGSISGGVRPGDARFIEFDKGMRVNVVSIKYGLAIRVFASVKLLKREIELAAGREKQGRIFHKRMVNALIGQDAYHMLSLINAIGHKKLRREGRDLSDKVYIQEIMNKTQQQNEINDIIETLESWHDKSLRQHGVSKPKKIGKRPKGELMRQVAELKKTESSVNATEIAEILNRTYKNTYSDTTPAAVRGATKRLKMPKTQNNKR